MVEGLVDVVVGRFVEIVVASVDISVANRVDMIAEETEDDGWNENVRILAQFTKTARK